MDFGGGICFLFLIVSISVGLVLWIAFWIVQGFRSRLSRKRWGWGSWLVAGLILALMVLFPPLRRAGDWIEPDTASPIPSGTAERVDRWFFGYIPRYGWIGEIGSMEETIPSTVKLEEQGPYWCSSFRWVVDWLYVGGEALVFAILFLPFLLLQRGTQDRSSSSRRP